MFDPPTKSVTIASSLSVKMLKPTYHHITWDPGGQPIPFVLGCKCLPELSRMLKSLAPDRILVLTEASLARKLGLTLRQGLPSTIPSSIVSIPPGEKGKNLATLETLVRQALAGGLTRQSVVLAFGGGLICNIAGMLAGGLFRGVRLVHLPTTLLAMHDTVTSLKQAVNVGGYKNLFGLYLRPAGILCDVQFCETLPPEAMQAALIEIVKNALILGEPFIERAREICSKPLLPTPEFCTSVVEAGVAAKRSLMMKDPFERQGAIVFEYGHTVGHAIESAGLKLNHGQCVYWGMRAAAEVAVLMGEMSPKSYQQHRDLLQLVEPVAAPREKPPLRQLMDSVAMDNKRGHIPPKRQCLPMVILKGIARPVRTDGVPLINVPISKLAKAISALTICS